ncbi:hypothetical protein H310_04184 [Aphanomyces invadans]|uniref:Uncharacterized protein n=1 Tax=Aphanomyces invadans TaxID=157072 RepID=A0A024UFJ9_9STRA|nr:hypothetical protein H310_04184 [Aphanomyces invadans]ETW05191.1 hypothetical protein H310_04184 [Aphanomyces invadans]|eukprot:XP_008866629.1 hypothetical protein H310_04184 [Aphanomyces invadans]
MTRSRGHFRGRSQYNSKVEFILGRYEVGGDKLFRGRTALEAQHRLEFIVQDQDEGTASTTNHVGASTLEESLGAFVSSDLGPAVEGRLVQDVLAASLHHHATTDRVERVRQDTGERGHDLGHDPLLPQRSVLGVRDDDVTSGIVTTEKGSAVHNDTTDRHTETTVQTLDTIRLGDGLNAVNETVVLTFLADTDISTQAGTGEVQGVHEEERGGTGSSARGQVTDKEAPELVLLHTVQKELLVLVLERKVQGLGGEVTDDVGQVAAPERQRALFRRDTGEAVDDTSVRVLDLGGRGLHLQQELDTFDGGDDGLGDTAGNTTGSQVRQEPDDRVFLLGRGRGKRLHFGVASEHCCSGDRQIAK